MASRFYGLDRGETEFKVTEASATTGKDVEVVFDLTSNEDRAEVLRALDMIKNHIISGQWPPA